MSPDLLLALILGVSAMVVLVILTSGIKIVREQERGLIFRFGRLLAGPKGAGLILLLPFVDRMAKIDLSTITTEVPTQEVVTRDNVTARVNAVVYFRVVDPIKSIKELENHLPPASQISQSMLRSVLEQGDIAQSTLRSVLGQRDFDDLLTNRQTIDEELQKIMDEQTEPWGIEVSKMTVKDVDSPE